MNRTLEAVILFGTLAFFLYFVNSNIIATEQRIATGQSVYLQLAPVDPRSLMQGDYMILRYQVERDLRELDPQQDGQFVAHLDENNVAQFVRLYDGEQPLAEDELLINYALTGSGAVRVGVDSFFFQEGLANAYENAEYAEVRVTPGGGVLLIDLVGEEFQHLVD